MSAQWTQCNFIQITPAWADVACNVVPLRGGLDEGADKRIKRELREDAKKFKSKREQLREIIARAYDPDHGKVAAEVQVIAAPYVERLESGKPQVDYAAI